MHVRLATAKDAEPLWVLVKEYVDEHAAMGAPISEALLAIGITYGIKHGEAVVVAQEDDDLIGFVAWVNMPPAAEGEVIGFGTYVRGDYRGCGISAQMRELAKEQCRKQGHKYVTGTALLDNVAGIHSACALGFEVVGYALRCDL